MDLIDTSQNSIIMGILTFIAIFFISKNLERYNDFSEIFRDKTLDPEDVDQYYLIKMYSFFVFISLILTFFIMVSYKKYLVYVGSRTLLDEPF
jgi:hypothetical protein